MKRYAIVGASHRCYKMFVVGLEEYIGKTVEFVGIYDTNRTRCEVFKKTLGDSFNIYSDFDQMLDTERPDAVLVATADDSHADYVVRSLDKGYDVLCEKPLTNTYESCLAIREAEKRGGKRVIVTFNCRFMPYFAKLKEVLGEGKIGKVYSVNYEYTLNRWHGGDYFKRWHRMMKNSQGMLVHKSTHHFDIVNWLLEDEPVKVSALGNRIYFGNPEKSYAKRCKECPKAAECESFRSQSEALDEELYWKAEHEDGYIRDKCAFLPDSDIYDNMSVSVQYSRGTLLTYSLNLFSMREGYTINLTGERGNILAHCFNTGYGAKEEKYEIIVLTKGGEVERITFDKSEGSHGGGDKKLRAMLFGYGDIPDELGQCADSFAGVSSAMIGIGANESIASGRTYDLKEKLDSLR